MHFACGLVRLVLDAKRPQSNLDSAAAFQHPLLEKGYGQVPLVTWPVSATVYVHFVGFWRR